MATLLALVPPAGVKLAIDSVFGDAPLPASLARWLPASLDAAGRGTLLAWIAGLTLAVVVTRVAIGLVGRHRATIVAKKLQVSLRRQAFRKAVTLPL